MWPYDQNAIETEERPTPCPGCGRPSTGLYKDDELLSAKYCSVCNKIFEIEQEERRDRIREQGVD